MQIGPLKVKAQLLCGSETAIGPGKADLLEAIDGEGSIAAAGRAMGMSYRRTWLLVDSMNRCWSEPLVAARAGGGSRSGARLTETGRAVLAAFRELERQLGTAAASRIEPLAALIRESPLPAGKPAAAGPGAAAGD